MRKLVSVFAALVLTMSLAGTALGATATSSTTVSATVDASISISGVPVTIDLGHAASGADLFSSNFTITVGSSEPTFSVSMSSTDFASGGSTIAATHLMPIVNGTQLDSAAANVPHPIGTTSPLTVHLKFAIPNGTPAGTYAATITFTASN